MSSDSESEDYEEQADIILEALQQEFGLPDAHTEYFRTDILDSLEQSENQQEIELQHIKKEIKLMPYFLKRKVGGGAFGNVYEGECKKTKKIVAVKIIDLEDTNEDVSVITREISALVNGKSCPQLTNYFGSTAIGSKLWLYMEYINGGSIKDQVDRKVLSEKQIAVVCREVLSGLLFLSREGRIHRDIKAANILLSDEGQVKLADFGATGQLTDTMTKCSTFVGSPYWMAPEVMLQNQYDGKADIWSLGITCIEMFAGKPPHSGVHPIKMANIIPKNPPPKLPDSCGADFKDFVSRCLIKDPDKRPRIQELLGHKFVTSSGNDKFVPISESKTK